MPLKDRDKSRPRRLARLGIIRLGYKEKRTRRDGSKYEFPRQSEHFILTDAPDVAEHYGPDPTELDVLLPFPDIARNFDAFYTVWAGGILVCKGDGEFVQYAAPFVVKEKDNGDIAVRNADGDTLVSDGQAQRDFDWNGQHFESGDLVPCPGADQDLYPHCAACRISAILKVMMAAPELFRLGYYQVATGSQRNYDTILGALELVSGNGARPINGIPFKLRLVEEQVTYKENGKRKATRKHFLQLEPDPTLTRQLYAQQAARLVGETLEAPALPEPSEAEFDVVDEEAPPPFAEVDEQTGEILEAAVELGAEVVEHEPEPLSADYTSIGTLDEYWAAIAALAITKKESNIALRMPPDAWCRQNNKDLNEALAEVKAVCGK